MCWKCVHTFACGHLTHYSAAPVVDVFLIWIDAKREQRLNSAISDSREVKGDHHEYPAQAELQHMRMENMRLRLRLAEAGLAPGPHLVVRSR